MIKWARRNIWLMPFAGITIVILLKGLEIPYTSVDTINSYLQDYRLITEYTEEEYGTGSATWYWLLAPFSVLVLWKLFISKSSSSGGGFLGGISKIMNAFTFFILVCVVGGGGLLILVAGLSILFATLDSWGYVNKNGLPLFLTGIW
jgi:hypothetical protein